MPKGLLAQEAYDESGTDTEDPQSVAHLEEANITLEHAALILADNAELMASVRRDLHESERLIQLSDALESIADVARSITIATPAEMRLLELAGQLVVAGTEVEPDRIVPAMECYSGDAVALESIEGIVLTAKRIWDSIIALVHRLWEKMRAFYRGNVVVSKYKETIANLRGEVDRAGKLHDEKKTFAVTGALSGIMLDMTKADSWHHLNSELAHFELVDDWIFKTYSATVLEQGAEVAKAIRDFDAKVPATAAIKLRDALIGHAPHAIEGVSTPFLGNGKVEVHKYDTLGSEDPAAALERLRISGVKYARVESTHVIEHGKEETHGIPAATVPEMQEVLKSADRLLDLLVSFYSHQAGQFEKTAKEIEASSDAATEGMAKLDKAEFGEKSIDYYRSMLNFNKAFLDWSAEPFGGMAQHTQRVVNSLMSLVRGSLTCYTTKSA